MKFQFISSGDGAAYEVYDWSKPWHGARLEIRFKAQPLYDLAGHRRFNYTPEEYQLQVEDNVGYLHWYRAEPIPWEVVQAFNEMLTERQKELLAKYPEHKDDPDYAVPLAKGRVRFELRDVDNYDLGVRCIREEVVDGD